MSARARVTAHGDEERTLRARAREVVESTRTRAGWWFDVAVQVLIVGSLISFAWETLPGLPQRSRSALRWFEVATVLAFTVEYFLRIWVAEDRVRFMRSWFGLIDLAAVLPFYLTWGLGLRGIDLRGLRALRMIRLVRLAKLARYSEALKRLHLAFRLAKEELVLFLGASGVMVYIASAGIWYCERDAQPEVFGSVFHSMWWAVATLTTVGYGDAYPVTAGGKMFTAAILFVGIGIVAVPAGVMASALNEARRIQSEPSEDV